MRILITGATGVLGRRVVPLLAAAGHEVSAVARSPQKAGGVERQGARAVAVDLFDAAAVEAAVRGHEAVIGLATRIPGSSTAFLPGAWRRNDRLRTVAAAHLARAALAAGCVRLVQESISLTYADAGERWIDEDAPVDPAPHTRSALASEAAAAGFAATGGAGVVLRFALFYGPDSAHTRDAIRFVRRGLAPTFGAPDGYVSSIHTDDAASAVVASLAVPAGRYNVADDQPLTRREYVDALAAALGVPPPRLLPAWTSRLGGSVGATLARSQRVSNARFRAASGWSPRHASAREGWRHAVG
jgi:2-alkyl-3-oxoalkanoate reductase